MKMVVNVTTSFNFASEPEPSVTEIYAGYPAVIYPTSKFNFHSRVEEFNFPPNSITQSKSGYNANGIVRYEINWSRAADGTESGSGGKYLRPNTDKVIATGLTWVATVCNFNSPTVSATYKTFETSAPTEYPNGAGPCDTGSGIDFFSKITTGNVVNRSATFGAIGNQSLTWIGIADSDQPGLAVAMTAAGAAFGPWRIYVQNGTVYFTDNSNNTTSFNGSIFNVVAAINSWPSAGGKYFDANSARSTSEAKTSDLKDFAATPVAFATGSGYCVSYFPIVSVGEKLAPSSTGVRFGNLAGNATIVFDPSQFPDNETGFQSFIKSTRYPKLPDFVHTSSTTGLPYYFMSTEFDVWKAGSTTYWSPTSGSSTKTEVKKLNPPDAGYIYTKTTTTYTLVRALCAPPRDNPIQNCDCSGIIDDLCNTGSSPFAGGFSCNGVPLVSCPPTEVPYNPYPCSCICENLSSTAEPLPYLEITATQTMTGSWSAS
jgi:hypothetical protein